MTGFATAPTTGRFSAIETSPLPIPINPALRFPTFSCRDLFGSEIFTATRPAPTTRSEDRPEYVDFLCGRLEPWLGLELGV